MTDPASGDQAFLARDNQQTWHEMTYGGALSFARRRYSRRLEDVDVVVSGIPYDCAVTYRSGCRLGPRAIRAGSTQLAELKHFPFGFNPFDHLSVIDYGDCYIDPHHPQSVFNAIERHAELIVGSGAKMLSFGGDHSVSYPLLKAHAKKYGPVALVQFDAHCDTWKSFGELDHGTMFLRAIQEGLIDVESSIQVGIRTHNEFDVGIKQITSPQIHEIGLPAVVELILNHLKGKKVYLSFDIDVLDPAFAPGTGTPVSGGIASWQALSILRSLEPLNMIGFDIVEVSPPFDHAEITSIAAATILHDWICVKALQKS